MRILVALSLVVTIMLAGCFGPPRQSAEETPYEDPRSLTHIDEARRLRIGMHEREVVGILGPPVSREAGYYGGTRLWFRLYNPKYETIPTNFLVSIDRYGHVTFISDGG